MLEWGTVMGRLLLMSHLVFKQILGTHRFPQPSRELWRSEA